MANAQDDFLAALDAAPLTPRYWGSIVLLVLQEMFEYYDFFVVSYLVAVLAPVWHLSYGESSIILLCAGLGAIFGSLIFGKLADVIGRKPVLVGCTLLISGSAALIAVIPENAWITFSLLRIAVGVGLGGAASAEFPLILEMTPTRHRTFLSSAMVAPVSLGILLAAVTSSQLLPIIGWRGLAAIGSFPILLCIGLILVLPESARWLLSQGRVIEARAAAAKQLGVPVDSLPMPIAPPRAPRQKASIAELYRNRRAFWLIVVTWLAMSTTTYGYQLWGPTILAQVLAVPVGAVAKWFILIAISGTIGRFVFSALPLWLGRRHTGEIMGWGAAATILGAGIYHRDIVDGWPAFVIWLTAAAIFVNGGFSNMSPYAAESYPVTLAARASGLAQAVNGVGKMLGPAALGLIAGAGNLMTPAATESAVLPAFIFLAACGLIAALAYRVLPIETHGRALTLTGDVPVNGNAPVRPATALPAASAAEACSRG